MKKIKYFFNTHTLRFEKIEVPLKVRLLQTIGFVIASLAVGVLFVAILFKFIDSPKERLLRQQNTAYKESYAVLQERMKQLELQMVELEQRDNEVYRSIFEATPIPDSARAQELATQLEIDKVEKLGSRELVTSITQSVNNLLTRIRSQRSSYQEVAQLIKDKEKLLAHTPAIQPVSNKNLNRIASGFGYRIDPIYKTTKLHAGLDFTAPQGTPIYATANGRVETAGNTGDGYGRHVIINHGYGYKTLYAHMVRVKARVGQTVKRGEVIGWVGSTGKSTGPHCHYEVIKNGRPIDPIYFFYNDLSPAQFDRILKQAAASNQSLD